jgi:1-acyl-sn-glycerol-3-phosphate acyltransferase
VSTYLPYRRGRLWVMCGDFVEPVTGPDRRRARAQMAAELERAYVRLYEELRERWQLADTVVP